MYPPIAPGPGDDDSHDACRARYALRDDAALNLAGRGARNGVGDVDLLRPLEVGQALLAVGEQLGLGRRTRSATTAAATSSPHVACGTPKHDRLGDRGMRQQHLVDLARRDLLAAAIDHLLEARRPA